MHWFLRLALTWALAIALPVQGLAATTMLLCGPAPHEAAATTPADAHDRDHAAQGDEHHASAAVDGDHGVPGHHGGGKAAGGKCSVCAACCTGTAMIQSALVIAVVPMVSVYAAALFEPHVGVSADGLERPPRNSLA